MRKLGWILILLGGSGLWGQDSLPKPEGRSNFDLDEVVVTAQANPGLSSRAIQQIRVINRQEIEAMGANNLNEVLKYSLNVRLSQDLILGSGLSLQGLSGQNVKIMVDGVPVIGRQNGEIDLSQINLNDIERIELIEGPMSVNFGTDALAGTINLISKKPKGRGLSLDVNAYHESVGTYNFDGKASLRKKSHALSISGGRYFFGGYSEVDTGRSKTWKPREQVFGSWKYRFRGKNVQLGVEGSYFDELITHWGDLRAPYFETAFDDRYRTQRVDHSAHVNMGEGQNLSFKGVAAYNVYGRRKNTWFKDLTTLEEQLTGPEDQDSSRFDLAMSRGTFSFSPKETALSTQWGYDVSWERGSGKRIEGEIQDQADLAGFALLQWHPLKKLKFQGGVRYGYNSRYSAPLTPSFNIWWKAAPSVILRGAYARGFRAPGLKELYLDFNDINHNLFGNPDLRAEYSHNFNFHANWKHLGAKSLTKIGWNSWFTDLRDQISLALVDPGSLGYSYVNVGRVQSLGANVNGTWKREDLEFQAGIGWTGLNRWAGSEAKGFFWTPELRVSGECQVPGTQLKANVFYKWSGALQQANLNENQELSFTELGDYHMLDVSLRHSFWDKRLNFTLGAKNLLNVTQVLSSGSSSGTAHGGGSSSVPLAWGRSFFLKLNVHIP